jgi:hypothetical protein
MACRRPGEPFRPSTDTRRVRGWFSCSRRHLGLVLPPLTGPLPLEPTDNRLPVVATVAAELEAGHAAGAALLPHPALGNGQPLSDLAGIQEALGQCARLRSACMTSTTSLGRQT